MDLRSANDAASWHPLTSLIHFGGNGGGGFYYVPVWQSNAWSDYSTFLHEMTHIWCARATRLGWLLSRGAADAFNTWQRDKGSRVQLPPSVQAVLSAVTPLLEGIAMYAQLDFEAAEQGRYLPSPLTIAAALFPMESFAHFSLLDQFRTIRNLTRWSRDEEGEGGLPAVLFLDDSREDLNFYFSGYLYVKAIAAVFARRCPAFSDPSIFLPILINLVCSHGIYTRALGNVLSSEEILDSIHQRLLRLTSETLEATVRMFREDEARESFDLWDSERQIREEQFDTPVFLALAVCRW